MDLGLRNKVALVTAASKGMGKASAMGLAAEGARVAMCARTATELEGAAAEVRAKTGAEVLALPADVTRPEQVTALVAKVGERFGGVDILVANSGGPARGHFEDVTDEQWKAAVDISLMSAVWLIRAVLPSMKARKWGRILTIQSSSVKQPIPELLLSNSVRPGVAGLMKTLALQLGAHNILVNTVCPGKIMTDRFMGGLKSSGLSREKYLETTAAEIPLGRIGTPEEFANVIVFLASERASYLTGVTLQVDGGLVRGLL